MSRGWMVLEVRKHMLLLLLHHEQLLLLPLHEHDLLRLQVVCCTSTKHRHRCGQERVRQAMLYHKRRKELYLHRIELLEQTVEAQVAPLDAGLLRMAMSGPACALTDVATDLGPLEPIQDVLYLSKGEGHELLRWETRH